MTDQKIELLRNALSSLLGQCERVGMTTRDDEPFLEAARSALVETSRIQFGRPSDTQPERIFKWKPGPVPQWCEACGEGVTTFCRGNKAECQRFPMCQASVSTSQEGGPS